jgi:hypothetical protein
VLHRYEELHKELTGQLEKQQKAFESLATVLLKDAHGISGNAYDLLGEFMLQHLLWPQPAIQKFLETVDALPVDGTDKHRFFIPETKNE